MITRSGFPRLWTKRPMYQDPHAGLIRTEMMNGVPVTWPIARPRGTHMPDGAPHYLNTPQVQHEQSSHLVRFNSPTLSLGRHHNMADLTDPNTWQRQYRFT